MLGLRNGKISKEIITNTNTFVVCSMDIKSGVLAFRGAMKWSYVDVLLCFYSNWWYAHRASRIQWLCYLSNHSRLTFYFSFGPFFSGCWIFSLADWVSVGFFPLLYLLFITKHGLEYIELYVIFCRIYAFTVNFTHKIQNVPICCWEWYGLWLSIFFVSALVVTFKVYGQFAMRPYYLATIWTLFMNATMKFSNIHSALNEQLTLNTYASYSSENSTNFSHFILIRWPANDFILRQIDWLLESLD